MYEEGWVSDESGFDFVERFRRVLLDPTSSPEEQREAARILMQIGSAEAVDALRWFAEHGEPDLAFDVRLALKEMQIYAIEGEPDWDTQNLLMEEIINEAEALFAILGRGVNRETWIDALAERLYREGHDIIEGARAMMRYNTHVIELLPIDMIVDGLLVVHFWTAEDSLNALSLGNQPPRLFTEEYDEADDPDVPIDPLDECYARVRTADFFVGLLLDVSGDQLTSDFVFNNFYRRTFPYVEYILSIPKGKRRRQ